MHSGVPGYDRAIQGFHAEEGRHRPLDQRAVRRERVFALYFLGWENTPERGAKPRLRWTITLTPIPRRAHVSRGLLAMADASDALVRVCVMYA